MGGKHSKSFNIRGSKNKINDNNNSKENDQNVAAPLERNFSEREGNNTNLQAENSSPENQFQGTSLDNPTDKNLANIQHAADVHTIFIKNDEKEDKEVDDREAETDDEGEEKEQEIEEEEREEEWRKRKEESKKIKEETEEEIEEDEEKKAELRRTNITSQTNPADFSNETKGSTECANRFLVKGPSEAGSTNDYQVTQASKDVNALNSLEGASLQNDNLGSPEEFFKPCRDRKFEEKEYLSDKEGYIQPSLKPRDTFQE